MLPAWRRGLTKDAMKRAYGTYCWSSTCSAGKQPPPFLERLGLQLGLKKKGAGRRPVQLPWLWLATSRPSAAPRALLSLLRKQASS